MMRSPDFKEKMTMKAEEVINLLVKNGERYGDDMLNLFKEQYPLMHCVAKCLRVKSMISKRPMLTNPSALEDMNSTISEESRDILGYALLLIAIEEGLIK